MSMNHTPGPWELWTSNSWRRITSRATGSTVCEPVTQRDGHPDLYFRNGGEDGPDARLLVAAPELARLLADACRRLEGARGMAGGICDTTEHRALLATLNGKDTCRR